MGKFHETRGEVSPRQRDCKRNVHDDALVGGSTRTETVLPMNREDGTIHWRDVDEQTYSSVSLWRASDEIAWQCECYSGRGVMRALRVWWGTCRGYWSACLEDGRINRSPVSDFLEDGPGS